MSNKTKPVRVDEKKLKAIGDLGYTSAGELAAEIGCGRNTIARWAREGLVPSMKVAATLFLDRDRTLAYARENLSAGRLTAGHMWPHRDALQQPLHDPDQRVLCARDAAEIVRIVARAMTSDGVAAARVSKRFGIPTTDAEDICGAVSNALRAEALRHVPERLDSIEGMVRQIVDELTS